MAVVGAGAGFDPRQALVNEDEREPVTVPAREWDLLLAVATVYVESFSYEDRMSLGQRILLRDVEAVVDKHGRKY